MFEEAERLLTTLKVQHFVSDYFWMTALHPFFTSQALPRTIWSERDTESWVWATIVRPAIIAAIAARNGSLKVDLKDGPNLCSGGGQSNIPDGVVFEGEAKKTTVEIKTQAALKDESFEMLESNPGLAVRFNWPNTDDSGLFVEDKILVQVRQQVSFMTFSFW